MCPCMEIDSYTAIKVAVAACPTQHLIQRVFSRINSLIMYIHMYTVLVNFEIHNFIIATPLSLCLSSDNIITAMTVCVTAN